MNTVYASDFGATGDGVTDDTAAVLAAMASFPDGGGTLLFGYGAYLLSSAIVLEPASGRDFISNIHWKGVGGHHTDTATTILLFGGDESNAGLTLKSCVQMTFEHINFQGAADMLALIKVQAAGPIPFYSSLNIAFRHCKLSAPTPIKALLWLNNCANIALDNDWFLLAKIALQIGSDMADAENEDTYSHGTVSQIASMQSFYAGDILIHRGQAISFKSDTFDENSYIGGRGARIYAEGDQLVRGLRLDDFWAAYGNDTGTFLTLGTSGFGLDMTNGHIARYAKGVVLNGIGCATIKGNEISLNTSGAVAIDIDNATFYDADVHQNIWTGMHPSAMLIQDGRSDPGSPTAVRPMEVNANLATAKTLTNHGVGYEDILSVSVKPAGGLYKIRAAMTLTNGSTPSQFEVRVILDAQHPRVGGHFKLDANEKHTFYIEREVILYGFTASTDMRLQVYQVTGPSPATVNATDTTADLTMMQLSR